MKKTERIVIFGVDWMGDVLFSTPILSAIKEAYPDAFLTYVTHPRNLPVLKNNPYLDRVLAYDEKLFVWGFFENLKLMNQLKGLKFDTALFLHRSSTRKFIAWCAGIPQRIGFQSKKGNRFLTIVLPKPLDTLHRSAIYAKILEPFKISVRDHKSQVFVTDEERSAWRELLQKEMGGRVMPYVVMHPGGNWELKRWPISFFKEVARRILDRGYLVFVCGTEGEKKLALELQQVDSRVVSFCGKTSLGVLGAMLESSKALISNDSGPLHLGAGIGIPVIGIFGPTDPHLTGPLTESSRNSILFQKIGCEVPCYFKTCHLRLCMEATEPNHVMEALDRFLYEGSTSR